MAATVQVDRRQQVVWRPQPGPQQALLACPIADVFYGGARGGGKTMGLLGDWLAHAGRYGKAARGVFLRRTYPEIEEVERQAGDLFPLTGARLNVGKRMWIWNNGATLRMRYLQREEDANHYQGHSYSWLGYDEMCAWSTLAGLDKLRACLRSEAGIPCVVRGTGNPGGPGHNLVKARYIDPAPPGQPFYDDEAKTWRVFIPSRLENNVLLMMNDPLYWQRIEASTLGRPDLLRAWRYGDWNVVAGGLLDDLWNTQTQARLAPAPFVIPTSWRIYRAFDWGSSAPFSVGWWAKSDGTQAPNGTIYPPGSVFRIGEWYGWQENKPNEGLRMLAVDVGKGIIQREKEMGIAERVYPGPADAAMWNAENGVCIADDMTRGGARFFPSDKAPHSRKPGAERVRKYLHNAIQQPMEKPGMFIFNTCRQWIRTVPVLPRNPKDPDDADSSAEDHCLLGSTVVETKRGAVPIKELVGTTGEVLTATGDYVPYEHCRLTRKKTTLVRVVLEDGREIVCTPDHRFLTTSGEWVEARNLHRISLCDIIRYADITQEAYHASNYYQSNDSGIPRDTVLPLRPILPAEGEAITCDGLEGAPRNPTEGPSYSP